MQVNAARRKAVCKGNILCRKKKTKAISRDNIYSYIDGEKLKNQLNDKTKSQIKMPKIFQMSYKLCQIGFV